MEKCTQNIPTWFGSWGKFRDGLVPGGSPDKAFVVGEVPIWFGCWGKSRDGFVAGGSPEM